MKKPFVVCTLSFVLLLCFVSVSLSIAGDKVESYSGKVTSVDPAGKAIVITVGSGKNALDVGAIVTPETVLMVKGKKMAIADLTKEIKPGDTVSLKVERTTDLYAKEISKK